MGHRLSATLLERQTWLSAVQGLNLRLLVAAQDQRMLGRYEVEADDAFELLGEARIGGEFERAHPVEFEAVSAPDTGHGRCVCFQVRSKCAGAPMSLTFGRLLRVV